MVELMDLPVEVLTMIIKNLDLTTMKKLLYSSNRILNSILSPKIEGLVFVDKIDNISQKLEEFTIQNRDRFILDSITSQPFLRQFVVNLHSGERQYEPNHTQVPGLIPFEECNPDVDAVDEAQLYGISRRSRINKEHRSVIASNQYLYRSLSSFQPFSDNGCVDERESLEKLLAMQHEDPTTAHLLTALPRLSRVCIINNSDLVCIYNVIVRTILNMNQSSYHPRRFRSFGVPLSRLTYVSLDGDHEDSIDFDMIRWFLRLPNLQTLRAEKVVDRQVTSGIARVHCGYPSRLQVLSLVQCHVLESTLLDEISRANQLTSFDYTLLYEVWSFELDDTITYYHSFAAMVQAFRNAGNLSLEELYVYDKNSLSCAISIDSIVSLKDFQKLRSLTCNITDLLPGSSDGQLSAVLPESLEYLELHDMQIEDVEHEVLPFLQHEKEDVCPLLNALHLCCKDVLWEVDHILIDNLTACLPEQDGCIEIYWPWDHIRLESASYHRRRRHSDSIEK